MICVLQLVEAHTAEDALVIDLDARPSRSNLERHTVSALAISGRSDLCDLRRAHNNTGALTRVRTNYINRTPARSGGLIIAEAGEPIGVASIALADQEREGVVELLRRYGRRHPTGAVTIPEDCLVATVTFTSRTPTHGLLRDATVITISPL
jgi:hypothetical protein